MAGRSCLLSENTQGSFDMADTLPIAGIVAVVVLVLVLAFYVRRQKKNNTTLFGQMNGVLLEGRLRVLAIHLQDAVEYLDGDTRENESVFSLSSELPSLEDGTLREALMALAKESRLGNAGMQNLQEGFDYLHKAVSFVKQRYAMTNDDLVLHLPEIERKELLRMLVKSLDAFEACRYRIDI